MEESEDVGGDALSAVCMRERHIVNMDIPGRLRILQQQRQGHACSSRTLASLPVLPTSSLLTEGILSLSQKVRVNKCGRDANAILRGRLFLATPT